MSSKEKRNEAEGEHTFAIKPHKTWDSEKAHLGLQRLGLVQFKWGSFQSLSIYLLKRDCNIYNSNHYQSPAWDNMH